MGASACLASWALMQVTASARRSVDLRFCQLNNVLYFENLFGIAFLSSVYHSEPHFLQGTKPGGIKCPAEGIEPGQKPVVAFYIFLARRSFHEPGAEHVRLSEQPHHRIFRSALYARPGNPSLFTAIGTSARYVAKGHIGIQIR